MQTLRSISPIDGRYRRLAEELANFFSEEALIKYRIIVEGEYLIALSKDRGLGLRKFTDAEKKIIRNLYNIETKDAFAVKIIEATTNHDMKAAEYYIKEKLKKTSLKDVVEWIHFALTSEDTNNIAYALMISEGLKYVIVPALDIVLETLENFAFKYKRLSMLARTHGQSASPTTLGKEFKVFASRLKKQIDQLKRFRLQAKLNGATGNYNAHSVAYPDINWKKFSITFIEKLSKDRKVNLDTNLITTQIESHDTYVELFDLMKRINVILIGFNQDMWRYISDNWITQKPKAGEIGSSTMPHKINPINFENAEGNLGIANALFTHFGVKLPISRLQRDLSDSTVERNFGTAFGHSLIAYKYMLKGFEKVGVNEAKIAEVLENHTEVIAEAIQTVLRREGIATPYEKLKELTRGKKVTLEDFHKFIDTLDVTPKIKSELKKITPQNYIGIASKF